MPAWEKDPAALNLLSLDGGGIRGASMLIILEELMHRFSADESHELKPCEVFDMIGGSGMGGVIAILLGRLGLSVADAIQVYSEISDHLYKDGYSRPTMGGKLEEAIQNVLKKRSFPHDARMMDHEKNGKGCKTFVVANMTQNMANPTLFRTYRPRSNPSPNCRLWEAARATTANRQLYPDMPIEGDDGISITYVGTEYRGNNPTELVIEESKKEFPGKKITLLISLGAGQPGPISLPGPKPSGSFIGRFFQTESTPDLTSTLEKIGRDCEEIADRMDGKFIEGEIEEKGNPYVRINVEQGMQKQSIDKMDLPAEVRVHTTSYLQTSKGSHVVDLAVNKLKKVEKKVKEEESNQQTEAVGTMKRQVIVQGVDGQAALREEEGLL